MGASDENSCEKGGSGLLKGPICLVRSVHLEGVG